MTKIYKVQMNSKGMPNFSTAVEVADRPQAWIPSMSACCRTCEYRLDGVKSDHTLLGSVIDIDSDMDGFICLALAYEGVAHWMLGVDEDKGICEMYKERSRR